MRKAPPLPKMIVYSNNKVLAPLKYLTVLREYYCDLKGRMFIPKLFVTEAFSLVSFFRLLLIIIVSSNFERT